ncbi:MAG: hypothetical protein KC502_02035 [Myxococcales bacterium]|nr:hypothetical protein [Myxococcales bacterium]
MTHPKFVTATAALLACALFVTAAPSVAFADEDEVPGEASFKTPFEFVKFSVNGKTEWENHEYTGRQKTLVIMGLSRSDDATIVLTPRNGEYQPLTIVIKPSDYKRKRVRKNGRRIAVFRYAKRVKFTKIGKEKPKAKAKAKPAPKAKKKAAKKRK